MRTGVHMKAAVVGMLFAAVVFQPKRAAADPIPLNVNLFGTADLGAIVQDWTITFPTFTVDFSDTNRLQPGFCTSCPNGSLLPLTQMTGAFSAPAHISGNQFAVDGDVALDFSFVGPTVVATLDQFGFFTATEPVQFSGMLNVTQGPQVFFQGPVTGSGTGTVSIEAGPTGSRLSGYHYQVEAVSVTPEPASIVLVGTGVLWLVQRRRRDRRADRRDL